MAFDSVPWFVGGGAQHSPEVARNMLYIATGGAEGISAPADLKVTSLPTPGTSVRIAPGSASILNRGTGGSEQTYSARSATATDVAVSPTGSAGGRSDLVVLRIEDPFNAGEPWQDPADPTVGPYVFPRIISGVPAGTTTLAQAGHSGDSAIVLARLDIPANTGTITDAMIVDLRKMAQPRQHSETNVNQNATVSTLGSDAWIAWPPYAAGVDVPEWATHAQVRAFLSGVKAVGPCDGEMALGLILDENNWLINQQAQKCDIDSPSQTIIFADTLSAEEVTFLKSHGWYAKPDDGQELLYSPTNVTGSGAQRFSATLGVYGSVIAGRGQRAYMRIRSHRLQDRPDRGDISVDNGSTIMYDVTFYERPI